MDNYSLISKPINPDFAFQPGNTNPAVEKINLLRRISYQNAIGSLLYRCTRPDISYGVSLLSRFNHSFNESHWEAVKNVFRYLNSTGKLGLTYARTSCSNLFEYCDAIYASEKTDYKSITGYIFLMQGSGVSLRSKKQSTISKSSTEAEIQAMSDAFNEILWLRNITQDLIL